MDRLDAGTIILGFTGSIGSGSTEIAKGIASQYKRYKYYCLSDILKDISFQRGNSSPKCEDLQELGDDLRNKEGNSFLVKKLFNNIEQLEIKPDEGIIVDSIRNDGEVATLRQFPNFYLFSVHAEEKIRIERTLKIKKFETKEEFRTADLRDQAEDFPHGQQVKKCNYLSDIIINNNDNIPKHADQSRKKFIDNVYNRYISLIENKKRGIIPPENLPTVDESLMTMAYAESQQSSCLKRKVGAIIASITSFNSKVGNSISESTHVISSGHNEVPFGSTPCVFNKDYEKCYRDYLQEKQAQKIKNCPSCGKKVILPGSICKGCGYKISSFVKVCPQCKIDFQDNYRCAKCGSQVFKEFLVSDGKLLDMCRALHAEENALLNLTKIGIQNSSNLVLYTTTYPCNLCANKIVTAGIKRVVYADPYTLEDAKYILETGKVATQKFEGIKSFAFFRLYNV